MTRCSILISIMILMGLISFNNSMCFSESIKSHNERTLVETNTIKNDIKYLTKSIEQVKTDQINYKTEKELLKDAYSSSLQTINLILTIILAIFGFFGYIGIKDINKLKSMYNSELNDLKNVKEKIEKEIKSFTKQQVRNKLVNDMQNKRLESIELRDQIRAKIDNKSYNEALTLIDKALSINKDDRSTLESKSTCLIKLNQLHDAIITLEYMLELYPNNDAAIVNLCEAYLLTRQIDKFDKMFNEHYTLIKDKYSNEVIDFLNIVKAYIQSNIEDLSSSIKNVLCYYRPGRETRLKAWDFEALESFLESEEDSINKTKLIKFINILKGKSDPSEFARVQSDTE